MNDTTSSRPPAGEGGTAGRARWIAVLLLRVALLGAAAFVLQLSGSAAWDAHVLAVRGEHRQATVADVARTSWMRPDRATVSVSGVDPPAAAPVITPRKDLDVGERVDVIVDPREPQRAALAGDAWPWRQVLLPLLALPLIALYGVKYGRWPGGAPAPGDEQSGGSPYRHPEASPTTIRGTDAHERSP